MQPCSEVKLKVHFVNDRCSKVFMLSLCHSVNVTSIWSNQMPNLREPCKLEFQLILKVEVEIKVE